MKLALDMLITLALLRVAVRGKDGGVFLSEMKQEIEILFINPSKVVLGYLDVICGKLNDGTKPSEYFKSIITEN